MYQLPVEIKSLEFNLPPKGKGKIVLEASQGLVKALSEQLSSVGEPASCELVVNFSHFKFWTEEK